MRKHLAVAIIIFMLITASITFMALPNFSGGLLNVGLLTVRAGNGVAERGSVSIIFSGDDFILNGKKLTGEIIVSFGGETHIITTTELSRVRRVVLYFSEGMYREAERIKNLYSRIGIKEGVSGREVIRRFINQGISGVTLPTLSITLWLNDEEGYDYVYNEAFTSQHYFMSLGHDYFNAFEKSFEDPLAIVSNGITIIIPEIESLSKFLIKTDTTPAIREIHRKLGLPGNLSTTQSSPSLYSGDAYQGGYYWNLPETPPQFFRERLAVSTPGVDEVWLENVAWQNFRDYYTRTWIFKKSSFPTIASVREFLNSQVGWCYRSKYLVNFEAILTHCLSPSPSYSVTWSHTLQPGTDFMTYKPFVITVVSSYQDIPPLTVGVVYGTAQAGLRKHGPTILGVLISGGITHYINISARFITFEHYDWQLGRRHAALIVPTYVWYYYDAFILRWDVWELNSEEWVAVPVPMITPRYEDYAVLDSIYWSRDYYDSLGNWVAGDYNYVNNIYTLLSDVAGSLYLAEDVLVDTIHSSIPDRWVTIDSPISSGTYYSENSLASIMFGVFGTLVSQLGVKGEPVLGSLLSLVGYADTTFYGSSVRLELSWRRTSQPQQTPIKVEKLTSQYLNVTYYLIGKKPLVAQYIVVVGQ